MMPRWLFYTLIAVLCWGLWAILSKLLGETISAGQSQALSTVGLLPIIAALACSKKLNGPSSNRRRGSINAFLSGVVSCGGNIAYYHALNLGGKASTVVPLTALYPLVTIVLAVLLLRERLNVVQGAGILLALLAIYLFNVASVEDAASAWLIYALVPIALWGLSGLLQKVSTNDVSGELSALWFLAAFLPVAVGLLIGEPLEGPVPVKIWVLVSAMGLFLSLGNYVLLLAFAEGGKASIIAPLAGLYPLVSIPAAVIFFGEKVSSREAAGIIVALISVVALAWETPKK